MACEAVDYWTFPELVAAFLDLLIAYCLLCASGFSFLASKLLGLFGLCLPCPCDGQFWNPANGNHCLQRRLIECPHEKISSVRASAGAKSPPEGGRGGGEEDAVEGDGNTGAEFGVACGLLRPGVEIGAVEGLEGCEEDGGCGVGGKRVAGRRLRHGLRRRRLRGGPVGHGKASSVSSFDTFGSGARDVMHSPPSVGRNGNDGSDDRNDFGGGREAQVDFGFFENASLGLELDDLNDGNKHFDGGVVLVEGDLGVDKSKTNTVRVLERALEEEHAARSALYLELEKERSAAASAADEAMAMILRLQEEKASIEMEARQYQRMIEAKAAYDAEEMNILKEILLRREREKHFLEKEVEAYRQMVSGNDQSDSDVQDLADTEVRNSTLYLSEDPILMMLQKVNDSIEKPKLKILDGSSEYEVSSFKSLNQTLAFGKELAIPVLGEDNESLKQKDVHEHTSGNEMRREFGEKSEISLVSNVKSVPPFSEDLDQTGSFSLCINLPSKESDIPYQENKDSHNTVFDEESCVYDVHVVDDESKMLNESSIEKNEQQSVSATSNVPRRIGSSSTSALTKYDVSRSCSDIPSGLPPTGNPREKARVTDFRRNSMSAVDYERVKIDNEVEWLTERLRIVQKGREKLNFSVGLKDRETRQLKLLEDIASQLREIRQLNEPGKAELQASLPPSYAKVTSKKRRWRSASLNIHRSS